MREGPKQIISCYGCKYRKHQFNYQDGNYWLCEHEESRALAPKFYPYNAVGIETPDWCQLRDSADRT